MFLFSFCCPGKACWLFERRTQGQGGRKGDFPETFRLRLEMTLAQVMSIFFVLQEDCLDLAEPILQTEILNTLVWSRMYIQSFLLASSYVPSVKPGKV